MLVDRLGCRKKVLLDQIALEGLQDPSIGSQPVGPGVRAHELFHFRDFIEQPRQHASLRSGKAHLPQSPCLRRLASLEKDFWHPGVLAKKVFSDDEGMHDRVKASSSVEILLASTIVREQTNDVLTLIERRRTPGPEISFDFTRFEHIIEGPLWSDQVQLQLANRPEVHVVVFLARFVHPTLQPAYAIEINAMIVVENAPYPDAGSLTVFLHADALALKIGRLVYPRVLVDENVAVTEDPRGENRYCNKWKLASGPHDGIMRQGHLRDVK